MTKSEFENLVFSHPKASFDLLKSQWQMQKVQELITVFNEAELDKLAFIFELDENGVLAKQTLNLKTFCLFVKEYLFFSADFWAQRTGFKGNVDLTNYEKTRMLKAFYLKKSLKKVPDWAQNIMFEG